jgi:hypothetical protein
VPENKGPILQSRSTVNASWSEISKPLVPPTPRQFALITKQRACKMGICKSLVLNGMERGHWWLTTSAPRKKSGSKLPFEARFGSAQGKQGKTTVQTQILTAIMFSAY